MLELEYWPIDKCIEYARNPRKNDHAVDKVAAAIKEFGFRVPIVAKSDGLVVDGHLRLKAAKKLKLDNVPVVLADDMTEAQIKAFRLSVNKVAELADWDDEMLRVEFDELKDLDFDIELTGFELDEIDALQSIEVADGLTDEDEVPEAPAEPVTKEGDVWLLGKHRVMCGDSTNVDAVEKLMAGEKADMVFTDPPWNVNYGAVQDGNAQGYKPRTILNDFMGTEEFKDFMDAIFSQMNENSKRGCPTYVVMSPQEWGNMMLTLAMNDYHWSSTIIWNKSSLILSRKDYHRKYEPIWYGWLKGGSRLCPLEDRKQSDVWDIDRPSKSELHPTTKPIELVERAIKNSSKKGSYVLDLFGGSGSTLIACEKTGRTNYSMELSPQYCDVIVKRWQDFTGKEATLESNGETFNSLDTNAD